MKKDMVIFINGIKGSGKDTVASIINAKTPHRSVMEKAAHPLYKAVGELFSLSPDEWAWMYQNAKEEPFLELLGMTPRESLIWLSEDVVKPKFGPDFFGFGLGRRIVVEHHDRKPTVFTVSDSGFSEEVNACMKYLGRLSYDFRMIRVERYGTSSIGDSRSVLSPSDVDIDESEFTLITNNGTRLELEQSIEDWMRDNGVL